MKNILIFGSGFGLYGYLPALIELGYESIGINKKHKKKFKDREDLSSYYKKVKWYNDENLALSKTDTVIIAIPPFYQKAKIIECLKHENINKFVLEKPISISPEKSRETINLLLGKKFEVGYNFKYTYWGTKLLKNFTNQNYKSLDLKWKFKAHHFENNLNTWKKNEEYGGGVLRFYGIHLIAFLTELKFTNVISSEIYFSNNFSYQWKAEFQNFEGVKFKVLVNSNSANKKFSIRSLKQKTNEFEEIVNMSDPFKAATPTVNKDRRILVIKKVLNSINKKNKDLIIHNEIINLWEKTEKISIKTI